MTDHAQDLGAFTLLASFRLMPPQEPSWPWETSEELSGTTPKTLTDDQSQEQDKKEQDKYGQHQ